ncbi:hypothetical protein [Streptomyces sp. NPDC059378]|uniref:hypothetical protein n=1 Tax=Streptomyces sp. NPDC059378 TaxID=3346815 RepID=UPI003675485A
MSETMGTGEPQEPTGEDGPGTTETKSSARSRLRGRRARWAVAGAAAVVVIGGGVAAAAIHHHEEEDRGEHRTVFAGGHEWRDGDRAQSEGRDGSDGPKERDGRIRDGERGARGEDGSESSAGEAPAPLPSLSAADALDKAAAAVKDGKVESLAPVTEQGGGQAWRIVVVGPDGVRHVVTVDGTGGTLTGNTVLDG